MAEPDGLATEVTDFAGEKGIVEVYQLTDGWREEAGIGADPHIVLSVNDSEYQAVVYLNMDQATKIVTDILSATREAKHGSQTD